MSDLEIMGVAFSNYVRSVRMLCEEKGVPHTLNPARPHGPEVLAINPTGLVPCMRHGSLALFESQAIATYIDKSFSGPKFIPDDAAGAAETVQWISYVNTKVDRWIMREFVVPNTFFDKTKGPDTARIAAAVPEIEKCLVNLDAAISKCGYLSGGKLTFADMNVLPMLNALANFPQGKEMLSAHPALTKYMQTLSARPSYVNTAPPPRK